MTKFPLREAARKKLDALRGKIKASVDHDSDTAELWIEGLIGSDVMTRDVRNALRTFGNRKAKVYVNSNGGSVTEGMGIYTELAQYSGGCDTFCSGLAASIASLIFQAGERRFMFRGSVCMIHLPWQSVTGNTVELEKQIEIMKKFETQMVDVYSKRTGKPAAQILEMLTVETWMTADEAIIEGFADAMSGEEVAAEKRLTLAQARAKVAGHSEGPKYGSLAWARSKAVRCKVKQMQIDRENAAKYPSTIEITRSKLAKLKAERSRQDVERSLRDCDATTL